MSETIQTEVVIVGAGPCGLFQVFELGLLGMRAHVLDSLKTPGGQCTELYPDKPIYDIPALPVCGAQELVDRLMQQIKPFEPVFHLGEEVLEVRPRERRFDVVTAAGTHFDAGAIVIAAGVGSFQPRRLGVPGCDAFEGKTLHYRVKGADEYRNKHLVIFGGGDSALDWVIEFASTAPSVTLVHRRNEFRAAPASVARMRELEAQGKLRFIEGLAEAMLTEGDAMTGVRVKASDGVMHDLRADHVFAFFGLHPKLGPVAEWGLDLERKALKVDTEKFQTNVPGIFAVGDINTYPGKKKLILSGFHEAALAAFGIQSWLYPEKKQFLQYTTTSPVMQKRLGVTAS
ncbi:MAG: NAD(P)/FAD-dependent oxidoreductase [Gammaproteobacteria bacterium]|nr:NAD(P)/FAD-dependent oxidoreductase [Gammaproteobacteria bacterium]NDB16918.1 NAD(P)/FAD-dependent oxidoreductase [Gammaproteobacteria bacterium]NDE87553.1 NAD(P)/FAD-dependent oxidoreductase [Gammaproteobacteria bacterium]